MKYRATIAIAVLMAFGSLPLEAQRVVMRGGGGIAPRQVVPVVTGYSSAFFYRPPVPGSIRSVRLPQVWMPTTGFLDPFFWGAYYAQQPDFMTQSAQDEDSQGQIVVLSNQVEQLTQEVQRLRDEQQLRAVQQTPPEPMIHTLQPATVLVFRDGHRIETQAYAVDGPTIRVFVGKETGKFPISD